MHSYRQTPPKDRTAVWAALIVTGMLLAGAIGWIASSIANRPDPQTASTSTGKSGDEPQDSLAHQGANPDTKLTESDKNSKVSLKPNSRTPESFTAPASKFDSAASPADRRPPTEKKSGGLPKLSDLTSLKNDSAKTRVKSLRTTGPRNSTDQRTSRTKTGTPADQTPQLAKAKNSKPTKSSAEQSTDQNQFALPQSTSDIVFYQELLVDRNPKFGIEGISALDQKFKYRTVSKMTVHPGDRNGFRKVSQKVVAANLISADSISRKSLVEAVKKLIGKEFQFTLDRKQKLIDFKGTRDEPKSINFKDLTSIEGFTGDGFMVSSVMDLDGWKEMAQLTFLLPDDKKKKWKDQMSHDWGELGRWSGETHFEKKNESNGMLRIDYAHRMRYDPTTKGKSKLPFAIGEKSFESTEAGGRLIFNRKKHRIDSLIERFRVSGVISASLLGSSTSLKLQEVQTFELKLHDQNPQ